jgi:hypothetical protein
VTSVTPGTDANTWYDYTSSITGGTVVSSATDTTPGRITNTGWNFGRAVYGIAPVDQSANGSFDIDAAIPIYGTPYLVDRTVNAGTFPDAITGASNLSIIREDLNYSGASIQIMMPYTQTTGHGDVAKIHKRFRTVTPAGFTDWLIEDDEVVIPDAQFQRLAMGAGTATNGGSFTSATDVDQFYTADFSLLDVGDMMKVSYVGRLGSSGSASTVTIGFKIGASAFTQMDTSPQGAITQSIFAKIKLVIIKTAATTVTYYMELETDAYSLSPKFETLSHVFPVSSTNALWNSSSVALNIRAASTGSARTFTRGIYEVDLIKAP